MSLFYIKVSDHGKKRVYLGVKTCEVFLCFVAIIFLGSIVSNSLFSLSLLNVTGSYTEDEPKNKRKKYLSTKT